MEYCENLGESSEEKERRGVQSKGLLGREGRNKGEI